MEAKVFSFQIPLKKHNCFLTLLFCISINLLYAQSNSYAYQQFTQEEGLPGNEVYSITQDEYGFLWIGTDKGLCRYDGHRFHEIEFRTTNITYGYKTPSVQDLFIDKKGHIRFKNYNTHYVYDKINPPEKVAAFKLGLSEDEQRDIRQIAHSENGNIWAFYNKGGIGWYDLENKIFKDYSLSDDMKLGNLSNSPLKFITKNNDIWLQDDEKRLYRGFLRKNNKELKWQAIRLPAGFSSFELLEDENRNIYAYKSQVLKYDETCRCFRPFLGTEKLKSSNYNIGIIKNMLAINGQLFIVGFDDQVLVYDKKTDKVASVSESLNSNVNTIFRSTARTLWLGTSGGLVKLSPVFNWQYFLHNSSSITSSRQEVRSIFQDEMGDIWVGTSNQVYQFNQRDTFEAHYIPSVQFITQDRNNTLWAGGSNLDGEVFYFDTLNRKFVRPYKWIEKASGIGDFAFHTLFKTSDEQLWAGGKGQLLNWQFTSDSLAVGYVLKRCEGSDFPPDFASIDVFFEDANEELWFAANGSETFLYHIPSKIRDIRPENIQYDCFNPFPDKANNYFIYAIKGSFPNLWLGTGNGLIEIDQTNGDVLHRYTTKSGLVSDKVCSILEDSKKNLWISTRKGLSYFDVTSREFNNFGFEEKLEIETFHPQAAFKNETTGRLFFGGINGVVNFHPDSLLEFIQSVPLPQVLITKLDVYGEPAQGVQSIYEQDSVILSKGEDYFELEYLVPHPGNLNCRYRYKLIGADEDWGYSTNFQSVNYKNLSPGTYQFQVQARSFNNKWENNSKTLTIIIQPYFWQTTWFRLAMVLLIFGAAAGIIYFRFRYLTLEKEAQEKELQRKTALLKALSSQMNPHFLYNSLNSINNFIASQDKRKANEYLADFATLMRMILNHSRLEKISLTKELECLELYLKLEHLRAGHKFDYKITVDKRINTADVFVPPMVIQPFIENAIWHGLHHKETKGHLDLTINKNHHHIVCHVMDDGIGIKKSKELQAGRTRKSTGIENVRERLRILNGIDQEGLKLEIKDRPEGGTHIEIIIASL